MSQDSRQHLLCSNSSSSLPSIPRFSLFDDWLLPSPEDNNNRGLFFRRQIQNQLSFINNSSTRRKNRKDMNGEGKMMMEKGKNDGWRGQTKIWVESGKGGERMDSVMGFFWREAIKVSGYRVKTGDCKKWSEIHISSDFPVLLYFFFPWFMLSETLCKAWLENCKVEMWEEKGLSHPSQALETRSGHCVPEWVSFHTQ